MDLDELLTIGPALTAAEAGGAAAALRAAVGLCAATDGPSLLGRLSPGLAGLVAGLDHVGFLAEPDTEVDLDLTAAALGFDRRTFPSTIFARELGAMVGRSIVPTTIFQARGLHRGEPVVVEVFLPQGVDTSTVREWMQAGVGTHVAYSITDPGHFLAIAGLMDGAGFATPRFMHGRPLPNQPEHLEAVYFDGLLGGRPIRLEFCHHGGAPPPP